MITVDARGRLIERRPDDWDWDIAGVHPTLSKAGLDRANELLAPKRKSSTEIEAEMRDCLAKSIAATGRALKLMKSHHRAPRRRTPRYFQTLMEELDFIANIPEGAR